MAEFRIDTTIPLAHPAPQFTRDYFEAVRRPGDHPVHKPPLGRHVYRMPWLTDIKGPIVGAISLAGNCADNWAVAFVARGSIDMTPLTGAYGVSFDRSKIILFRSYAYGRPRPDWDLDSLVIPLALARS